MFAVEVEIYYIYSCHVLWLQEKAEFLVSQKLTWQRWESIKEVRRVVVSFANEEAAIVLV